MKLSAANEMQVNPKATEIIVNDKQDSQGMLRRKTTAVKSPSTQSLMVETKNSTYRATEQPFNRSNSNSNYYMGDKFDTS